MTYRFAANGDRLLWTDAFGLSRLQLAGNRRIKTNRELPAGVQPQLSMSADSQYLLHFQQSTGLGHLYDQHAMKLVTRFAESTWQGLALHPNGTDIIAVDCLGDDRIALLQYRWQPRDGRNKNATILSTDNGIHLEREHTLYLTEEQNAQIFSHDQEHVLTLGPKEPSQATESMQFQVHHDGSFCLYNGHLNELYFGNLPGCGPPGVQRFRISIAELYEPQFFPRRNGLLLTAYDSESQRALTAWFPTTPEHPPTQRHFPALSAPQRSSDTALAYIATPTHAHISSLHDDGAFEAFPLKPVYHSFGTMGFSEDTMPGQLMANESHLYFLPSHGESIIDLRTGRSLRRRLPEDASLRQAFMLAAQKLEAAGQPHNLHLRVGQFYYDHRIKALSLSLHTTPGDGTLCAALVQANIREQLLQHIPKQFDEELHIARQWMPDIPELPPFTIEEQDVEELFAFATQHQLPLRPLYQHFLKDHYTRCLIGRGAETSFEPCAPSTEEAEQILIWSMVEALGEDRPKHHREQSRTWQRREAKPEELYARIKHIDGKKDRDLLHTIDALGLVLGHYFSELPLGRVGDTVIVHDYIPGLEASVLETTEDDSLLAATRHALHQTPSPLHFRQLMDLFENEHQPDITMAIQYAQEHLKSWPPMTRVNSGWLNWQETHPAWALVRNVDLHMEFPRQTGSMLQAISQLPCAQELVGLCIAGIQSFQQRAQHVQQLLDALPSLTHFKIIRLAWNHQEIKQLASTRGLSRLASLHLPENELDHVTTRLMLHSPYIRQLKSLDLSRPHWSIHDSDLSTLTETRRFDALEELRLDNCQLRSEGIYAFAESLDFISLKLLSLHNNWLHSSAFLALVRSPTLPRLEAIYVSSNSIDDQGIIALANTPEARKLKRLSLSNNNLSDAALHAIAASPYLDQLDNLWLQHNAFTDDGIVPFVCAGQLALEIRLPMLAELTHKGLTRVAKHFGISGYSKLKRNQLEAYIRSKL